jgi:hypothetical protein
MGDASGSDGNRDALIGKLALELHWITALQLREALTEQWADVESGKGRSRSLGSILVSRGILTGSQLDQLYERIQSSFPSFPPFGKYHLVREIGRGDFGVVYEAEDQELKRRVALKLLAASVPDHPEEAAPEEARFVREGQLHRSLPPHPGVVPVLEAGVIDGRRYLAQELVDGVAMDVWQKHGSITVRQRVALLRDVALALHHAHQHGIVHRALKPGNILVDRNHQPRLTDFGLAGLAGADGAPKSPAYLSPEQVSGVGGVDHRADLYSLGVMLYEVLTSRRPFEGSTPEETMSKTVKEPVLAPSKITCIKINPVIYRNLENICLVLLAKKPEDRYADASRLAGDLTRWLKGEDVRIAPPGTWRLPRARQVVRLLAVGAVLAGVAAEGNAYLRRRAPMDQAPKAAVAPAMPPAADPLHPGSIAEYYAGMNFNALGLRKIDYRSTFDDPTLPLWREGPGTYTSRRWSGFLRVAVAGTYVFDVKSRDPARLVIGDFERYRGQKPATLSIPLDAGDHRFLLEHAHAGADDTVSIAWQKPGETTSTKLGPGALFHAPRAFLPVQPQPADRRVLGPVPGAEEGETLEVIEDSGHHPTRKSYGPFAAFWKGSWSGSQHLFWNAGPGDRLKVRFAAGETGMGTIVLGLTRATDHGIFRISVNGAVIVEALDQFANDLITREAEFQNVKLKAGANELQFEVVGSNPEAREWAPGNGLYKLGLDYVLVR